MTSLKISSTTPLQVVRLYFVYWTKEEFATIFSEFLINLKQHFACMQIKILSPKSSLNELLHLAVKIAVKASFQT